MPERRCGICGASLAGRRADARSCSAACRAEASRLRRLLAGNPVDGYGSVFERSAARKRTRDG